MSVRQITATMETGGATVPLLSADCYLSNQGSSSRFRAEFPIRGVGGNGPRGSTADVTINIMGKPVFRGVVDSIRIHYAQGTVHVTGRDLSAKLHELTVRDAYQNMTRQQIILDLVGKAGLDYAGSVGLDAGDAGKAWKEKFHAFIGKGESAWSLIQRFAGLDGVIAYVNAGGTLVYKRPEELTSNLGSFTYQAPTSTQHATSNFVDLHLTHNVNLSKTLNVSVKGWHAKRKAKVEGRATRPGEGGELEFRDDRYDNITEEEANAFAEKAAQQIKEREFGCSVTIPGDPKLNDFGRISLSGTAYDGTYNIESINHIVSAHQAYRTVLNGSRGGDA